MNLESYRESEFAPSIRNMTYLNHAASSPSPTRVVAAVHEAIDLSSQNPEDFFMKCLLPAMSSTRRRLANLMGVANANNIALMRNTGQGLAIIADGLKLDPGDNVVIADCEYPSVVYPWYAQKWRGVETRVVKTRPDGTFSVEDFAAAMDSRTRVIALSWVQFSTGFRADLAAFTELAHSHNALIVADVIQGLGVLPLEGEALGLDVIATGSHKWLMGPCGSGGLYIAPHVLDRFNLVNMGAVSVVDVIKFDSLDFSPKPNAQRYEEGSPNGIGLAGLNAALSILEEIGPENIARHVLSLTDYAANALDQRGYIIDSPREDDKRAGILLFHHDQHASDNLMQTLKQAGVVTCVRSGKVRVSPHFYNTKEDIDKAVNALP